MNNLNRPKFFLIISFFISISLIVSCNNINFQNKIYGFWEGNYLNNTLILNFKNHDNIIITVRDNNSGLSNILNGNYYLDFSKSPMPLSITNIQELNHPLYTIVEFINHNSIRIGSFSPRWKLRNISFDKNKSIILKRTNIKELN